MNEVKKLVRISNEIVLALERNKQQMLSDKYRQLEMTVSNITSLIRTSNKLGKANGLKYVNAGKRLCAGIVKQLTDINYNVQNALQNFDKTIPAVPKLKNVYEELENLSVEFGSADISLENHIIAIETEPVVLEELSFGTFRIELDVSKIQDLHRDSPYYCIAQQPNPAAANSAVTHPHVSDDRLCEGEGFLAIRTALQQGRICDFFSLIRSILNTYNPDSPYISISEWCGIECYDCGCTCDSDGSYYCSSCDRCYCESCSSYCRYCEDTCCLGCGGQCQHCEQFICSGCMSKCSECEGSCCKGCLEDELCPNCIDERDKNEQEEQNDEKNEKEQHCASVQPDCLGQGTVFQG